MVARGPQRHHGRLGIEGVIDVVFKDTPLDEIVARRKRFEFRLSFRRPTCDPVRKGDLLLLKREADGTDALFFRPAANLLVGPAGRLGDGRCGLGRPRIHPGAEV
jgi:hypothetical protein